MLLNLLLGLLSTAALLAAGLAVALTWAPERSEDDSPLFHVALALGWGFGLVPFIAFCIALFSGAPLVAAMPLGVAVLVGGAAGAVWWRRGRVVPAQLREGWREARWVLLACGAVGLVYLLKYDRSVFFLESCIHRVVMQTLQLTAEPIDILASNADDQRLGNTSVISSFVVLYRGLGFRLLYAFVGSLIALGGYLLGRRALGHAGWGWFALVVLPLNPYVAKIPLLDENLLTLGYSCLFLPLLLRRRVPWAHVGALLGLAVMMRHIAILCVPAVLWAVWIHTPGRRLRALGRGFAAFTAVTLVAHIHHYLALGSVFRFESFGQIPTFEHRFLGPYSGLLQWPFAEHVLRTPWNPLPTFALWPVYLADHLGLVLFAAMLVGSVALLGRRRREGVFWFAWLGLTYAALSLQENWDVPNKMGVIYIVFHPLVIWAGAGLQAAARAPRTWGIALAAVALTCGFGVAALRHLDVPADERYYAAWTGEREEDPAYVQAERDRLTDVAPWPDFGRLGPFARVLHPEKLSSLFRDLRNPAIDQVGTPYGWFPGQATEPDRPVTIDLELGERLFDAEGPIATLASDTGQAPHVDLTVDGPPIVIPNIRVSWSPRPITALVSRGRARVTGVSLIFEEWARADDTDRLEQLHERYHRGLQMVLGWAANDMLEARVVHVGGTRLRLRVPAGPFSLVESVNNAGQNYLFWRAELTPGAAVDLEGPYRVFHN